MTRRDNFTENLYYRQLLSHILKTENIYIYLLIMQIMYLKKLKLYFC